MQNDSQLPNPDWLNSAVGALEASITRGELQPGNERYCARLNEAIAALNQFAHQSAQLQQLGGRVKELEGQLTALREDKTLLIGALQEIARTQPQTVMNGNARMEDPPHIKGGWNFHFMARNAIQSALRPGLQLDEGRITFRKHPASGVTKNIGVRTP